MTSKTEQVHEAVKARFQAALPFADVVRNQDKPGRPSPGGKVNILDGDPEEIGVDFNPPTWMYQDEIPVEIIAPDAATLTSIASAIGQTIASDRFLGGLCDYIRVTPMKTASVQSEGTAAIAGGEFSVIALYSTASPLG